MTRIWRRWAEALWYKGAFPGILLIPFAWIFSACVRLRRWGYRNGWLTSYQMPVPVIVVGNISVGGTGKTPLVIWLAEFLKQFGYKPGIISRGYGGKAENWPQPVTESSDVRLVGDESVLIAKRTQLPVMVGPVRTDAATMLLADYDCNVIISDDGLQHYQLQRVVEIAVIDGVRRFGNGFCLPAGPLREPPERLQQVDFVMVNGRKLNEDEFAFTLIGDTVINLATGEQKALARFGKTECHALAGIGNPQRFFSSLAEKGVKCETQGFPDHYVFERKDIEFGDNKPVLMTEKDAVKCFGIAGPQHWFVPVEAEPEPEFGNKLLTLLAEKHDR
jgi:tetraacyldisaccharide 4'-kinase